MNKKETDKVVKPWKHLLK